MTLPVRDRTCHRCDFNGDVSLFWRRDAKGEYLKSPHSTVPIDRLRYGREEAQKYAYFPNREICPKCGYECDSYDEAVETAYYARCDARQKARARQANQGGCMLLFFALPAGLGALAWLMI